MDTKAGAAAQEILDKTIRWNDRFYDDGPAKILEMIRKNNSNGIIYIEFHYFQIGLTNAWLRTISNQIGDPLTVRREILLQRIHGSDLSPYPRTSASANNIVWKTANTFLKIHFTGTI